VQAFCQKTGLPVAQPARPGSTGRRRFYLNEAEARFNRVMLDSLLKLGVKAPIATTNQWAGGGFYTLPALSTARCSTSTAMATAARCRPPAARRQLRALGRRRAMADKPVSITEWT